MVVMVRLRGPGEQRMQTLGNGVRKDSIKRERQQKDGTGLRQIITCCSVSLHKFPCYSSELQGLKYDVWSQNSYRGIHFKMRSSKSWLAVILYVSCYYRE